ncbi:MAG: S-layer homology domain-containing protein [Tissierellia bacterium]|nr:S-layer homology domain-containing protein [Tissierellia bacterium]
MKKSFINIFAVLALLLISASQIHAMSFAPAQAGAGYRKEEKGIEVHWNNPQGVLDALAEGKEVAYEIDVKKNDEAWAGEGKSSIVAPLSGEARSSVLLTGKDHHYLQQVDIFSNQYSFKVHYLVDGVAGPETPVVAIGVKSDFNNGSSWSAAALETADKLGIVPNRVREDVKKNITRSEFTEVLVRIYELESGTTLAMEENIYVDTGNPYVLKATALGLVKGVDKNHFAPDALITREEMAIMLSRFLDRIDAPKKQGSGKFTDQAKIHTWAKDHVMRLQGFGLLEGFEDGSFRPLENTTREQAIAVAVRLYDYYANK